VPQNYNGITAIVMIIVMKRDVFYHP